MNVPNPLLGGLARQLSHPSGLPGRLVARILNKRNRAAVAAAVEALDLNPGGAAADAGFGGGLSLGYLMDRVGAEGTVHGVDVSALVLARAARRFRSAISAGRLYLHDAPMTRLPLADGSVDAVMTLNTIYFITDLDRAFAELRRILRPSGRAAVGLGDPAAMATDPVTARGFTLRPVAEVVAAMRAAGLEPAGQQRVGDGDDAFHLLIGGT